jgi:hypothetical protein
MYSREGESPQEKCLNKPGCNYIDGGYFTDDIYSVEKC